MRQVALNCLPRHEGRLQARDQYINNSLAGGLRSQGIANTLPSLIQRLQVFQGKPPICPEQSLVVDPQGIGFCKGKEHLALGWATAKPRLDSIKSGWLPCGLFWFSYLGRY